MEHDLTEYEDRRFWESPEIIYIVDSGGNRRSLTWSSRYIQSVDPILPSVEHIDLSNLNDNFPDEG